MAIRDDIEGIKTQIVGEGRFLEYLVKFERFYKKLKWIFLVVLIVLIGAWIYVEVKQAIDNKRIEATTIVFENLLKDPTNKELSAKLKEQNKGLYELFVLNNASKTKDTAALKELADSNSPFAKIAAYQLASLNQDLKALQEARSKENSVLQDLSIIQTSYLLLEKKDYKQLVAETDKMPITSDLKAITSILSSFGSRK